MRPRTLLTLTAIAIIAVAGVAIAAPELLANSIDVGAGTLMASWSISYPSRQAFLDDKRGPYEQYTHDAPAEVQDQIRAARAAATALINSGAAGRDVNVPGGHKDFSVTIGGHANPGHEPQLLYANDCVYVNLAQKTDAADLSPASRVAAAAEKSAPAPPDDLHIEGELGDGSGEPSTDDGSGAPE